uniref:Nucleostemin-like protein 1 n=1 Tax=Isodiametra pulchra TaxID=504439 RepID=D2T1E0_ISOPU|nr:nucleostemin-like protein 1 [Isodiametra pulchra]
MGKKPSKRLTLKKKYKIEKKVKQHHKKERREAKKNPKKKNRKDPGVPNSLPFREQILQEVALKKQQLEEEKEKKREEAKQRKLAAKEPKTLEQFAKEAADKDTIFESLEVSEKEAASKGSIANERSRRFFFKEFKKVIIAADVVIQVLDARDPLACRCKEVEQQVIDNGKKLVLLLNKIDLVPKENVFAWLEYLRKEFPTLPFKGSTQHQKANLGKRKVKLKKIQVQTLESSLAVGVDNLMRLLGNYSRNNDMKTAITIGVVGIPNVGKSSVINSLKRSRACNVGSVPGVTRSMQEVQLDSKLRLLDSPGVVIQKQEQTGLVLRNCVNMYEVQDPEAVVEALLKKVTREKMMIIYNIRAFETVRELLAIVAYKKGFIKKGGIPNLTQAAKSIIEDWNSGRIRYYTNPPASLESNVQSSESASIVSSFSKEFDIDSLLDSEKETLQKMDYEVEAPTICVDTSGPMELASEEQLEQEASVVVENRPAVKPREPVQYKPPPPSTEIEGNQTVNRDLKTHLKSLKKQRKKTMKLDQSLAEAALEAMDLDVNELKGDYDFKQHFDMDTKT